MALHGLPQPRLNLLRRDNRWAIKENGLDHLVQPEPDPAEDASRRDAAREILACLEHLPQNQKDAVRLRFQQNLSYKEIAEITGSSTGQVGFLLHDAMKRLRHQLELLRKKESRQEGGES